MNKSDPSSPVPSFQTIYNDLVFTYVSPNGDHAAMDFLGSTIRSAVGRSKKEKEDYGYRIVLICQQNSEAWPLKTELEKRNVSCLQISEDQLETQLRLWSQGVSHNGDTASIGTIDP